MLQLPSRHPLVQEDLRTLVTYGRRLELFDGTLVVSASCEEPRRRTAFRLAHLLESARLDRGFTVVHAPLGVTLADDTVIAPDIAVVRIEDPALILLVDVLPVAMRSFETLRRASLEAAGCPSYWVVDPDVPSLVVWELRDGRYVEVANVRGDDVFHAELPYPVEVSPAALVDRR